MTRHRWPDTGRRYRRFPSRYGWNRPRGSWGWLGWTIGIRLALPVCIVVILLTNWRG